MYPTKPKDDFPGYVRTYTHTCIQTRAMFNCGSIELRTICDQKARSDRRRTESEQRKREIEGTDVGRRAHGGRNTPTRILKSGPTNAIKRANYPWGGKEEGEEGTPRAYVYRARILSTCLTRTLEAHSSHRECSHTSRAFERSSLNLPARSYVLSEEEPGYT